MIHKIVTIILFLCVLEICYQFSDAVYKKYLKKEKDKKEDV